MRESKVDPQQKILSVTVGLLTVIIGLFVVIKPFEGVNFLLIVALLALGLYELFGWFRAENRTIWALAGGCVSLLFAVLALFNIINILFIWDILLYTIPIWAICNGLIKLAGVFALMRRGEGGFGWKLLTGFFGILLGALLLILPAAGIMTMTEFTGILTGVLLLVFGINVIVDAYA